MTVRPPGANRGGRRRPAWEVLDAARERRFTGVLTLGTDPVTDVYLDRGRVYLAECDGDPAIGLRLVAVGVLSLDQLDEGSVSVADEAHLGRVFELVPDVDRARVVAALESVTDETVVWLAVQTPEWVTARPYLRHPSGVDRWDSVPVTVPPSLPAPLPDAEDPAAGLRGWTVPDDVSGEARGETSGGRTSGRGTGPGGRGAGDVEVRIDWFDDGGGVGGGGGDTGGGGDGAAGSVSASTAAGPDPGDDRDTEAVADGVADADLVTLVVEDDLDEFTVVWPSGETARPRPVPPPPGAVDDSPDPWLHHAGLSGRTGRPGSGSSTEVTHAPDASPFDAPPAELHAGILPVQRTPGAAPFVPPSSPSSPSSGTFPSSGIAPSSASPSSGTAPSSVGGPTTSPRPAFPPPPGGVAHGSPGSPAFSTPAVSEQMRLAIRRTIAAIEDGMRTGADPSSRWSEVVPQGPDTRGPGPSAGPTPSTGSDSSIASPPPAGFPGAAGSTGATGPTDARVVVGPGDDDLWGSWVAAPGGDADEGAAAAGHVLDDHATEDHDTDDDDPWADGDVRHERRTGPRAGAPFHETLSGVSGGFPATFTASDIGSGDDEVRRGRLPSSDVAGPGPGGRGRHGGDDDGRRRALRRLIDGLRNR